MQFSVKAVSKGASVVSLELAAGSEQEARNIATTQGLTVVSVRVVRGGAPRQKFPLLHFNQELLALLRAGIPLAEAIAALAEKEGRDSVRETLAGLLSALRDGRTLSAALGAASSVFPDLYVAMIRAAERTSNLEEAIERFIAYQQQVDTLRDKLVSAAIYPVLLVLVGGLVVLFLLGYVVPRFSHIYEDVGGELPFMSRLLLDWGTLIEANAAGGLVVLMALVVGSIAVWRNPPFQAALGRALWKAPFLGERLRVFQLARFYRTMGMLASGGIPVPTALGMVTGLLTHSLREGLNVAIARIREGKSFSASLAAVGLATPVAIRMLEVGERAGNLGDMLTRAAEFHEEDTARQVDWLTRLFGPLLMLFIGGAIGLIVVLMYLPIFQLAESIG